MADLKGERLWYIVQTYSGKENSVKDNLVSRIKSMDMEDQIFQVMIPEEVVIEKKEDGTVKEKMVKIFPGYVFIEMIDNEKSWWVVRNTPGVTGFLGSAGKKTRPVSIPKVEMDPILKRCGMLQVPAVSYHEGDTVTVVRGNFKDQIGVVDAIDLEKMETVVLIELFGRQVEVTVQADDVEIVE